TDTGRTRRRVSRAGIASRAEIARSIAYARVRCMPQHAGTPVLTALRAGTGAQIAIALHHLQEVRHRTGCDGTRRATRPLDGDALMGDALGLADRDLPIVEFVVHERPRTAPAAPVRVLGHLDARRAR